MIKKHLPGARQGLPLNLAVGLVAMGLSACSITPEPLSLDQQLAQASPGWLPKTVDARLFDSAMAAIDTSQNSNRPAAMAAAVI